MADRVDIPFPSGGLSDALPFGDQQPGTTREAKNVRAVDAETGRNRGGQRPGLSMFSTDAVNAGDKVQAITSLSVHNPRTTYSQRLVTGGTNPFVVNEGEWKATTRDKGNVKAIATDRQSNVYALDDSGVLYKYSSDGELIEEHPVASWTHLNLAPSLEVDAVGGVYVGGGTIPEGEAGDIIRLHYEQKTEESGYFTETYRISLNATPVDFKVQGDRLYVLMSRKEDSTSNKSAVRCYAFIFSGAPALLWEKPVPHPSNNLAVNSRGQVFVTAQPNSLRGAGDNGNFKTVSVSWVPNHLANAHKRIHYWFDATRVLEPSGELHHLDHPILVGRDRRLDDTTSSETDPASGYYNSYAGPFTPGENQFGTAGRHLTASLSAFPTGTIVSPEKYPPSPRFQANQFGQSAAGNANEMGVGVLFERTQWAITGAHSDDIPNTMALPFKHSLWRTGTNDPSHSGTPDATTSATIANNGALLPGWDGASWTLCMVVKFERDPHVGALFYHNVGGVKIAIWANAKGAPDLSSNLLDATDSDFVQEGGLRIHVDTGELHANAGTGSDYSGSAGGSTTSTHFSYDNNVDCAIITIHFGNPDGGLTGSANAGGVNQVRVNGKACYEFKADANTNGSSASSDNYSMFGTTIKNNIGWYESSNNAHENPDKPPYSFVGALGEVLVVLPNTTSSLFDTPTTCPCGTDLTVNPTLGTHGVGTVDQVDNTSGVAASTATEVEHLEGYLAHKYGVSHILPHGYSGAVSGYYKNHPFGDATGGQYFPGRGTASTSSLVTNPATNSLASTGAITAKYDGNTGAFVWAAATSGMGYGIAVDQTGDVYTVGTDPAGEANGDLITAIVARKIIDNGSTYSVDTSDGAWAMQAYEANEAPGGGDIVVDGDNYNDQVTANKYTRLLIDSHGDLYWCKALAASSKAAQVVKIIGTTYTPTSGGSPVTAKTIAWYFSVHHSQDCFSVALPSTQPGYGFTDVIGPERMFLGTSSTVSEANNVRSVRLVNATINNSGDEYSPRSTTHLAVAGGSIRTFTRDGSTNQVYVDAALDAAGNADAQLSSTSDYVQAVPLFGKVYFSDGLNYRVYHPPLTGQTGVKQHGEVKEWKAAVGEMPVRPKIMVGWHGRIVMARTADDAFDWQMSKIGDPFNWDYYPTQITPTQAVTGASSRFGKSPDIINALIPYSDDLLIVGGDATIMRMTGDPMAGGQLDLVSDTTGMAYGRSWCRGPDGSVFFFGSRGGVFALSPAGAMARISGAIDRRLIDVDTAANKVELVWDHIENGLHVFLFYYGSTVATRTHYFWDSLNAAWYEDTFTGSSVQPTAVATLDGDTGNDRVMVVGGPTGLLYFWDRDAKSDNGTAIESEVLLGPLAPNDATSTVRWTRLEALMADSQGGVRYELMANDNPDTIGDIVAAGELSGGPNPIKPVRAKGRAVWLRLRNRQAGERWAMESIALTASTAGRRRIRS